MRYVPGPRVLSHLQTGLLLGTLAVSVALSHLSAAEVGVCLLITGLHRDYVGIMERRWKLLFRVQVLRV